MPWPRRNSGWRHSSGTTTAGRSASPRPGRPLAIWACWPASGPTPSSIARGRPNARPLALAYRRLGRLDETDQENRAALGLAEELVKERPDSIASQYLLGHLLCSSAYPRLIRRDVPGFEANLSRALSIFEALVRQNPKVKKYRVGMGDCFRLLGDAYVKDRRFAQCQDADERGLAIFAGLVAEHPQCIHCRSNLARHVCYKGVPFASERRSASCDCVGGPCDRNLPVPRRAGVRSPSARRDLWGNLANRAEILLRLGRYAEALADYEEMLAIQHEAPQVDPEASPQLLQLFHALTKARLGDLSALAHLGEQVRHHSQGKDGHAIWLLDDLLRRGLRPRGPGAIGAPGPGKTTGRTPTSLPNGTSIAPWNSSTRPASPANSRGRSVSMRSGEIPPRPAAHESPVPAPDDGSGVPGQSVPAVT